MAEQEPEHVVHTISGGSATGDSRTGRKAYVRHAREVIGGLQINMTEHIAKFSRKEGFEISFTEEEARKVIHPRTDSLVIEIKIANSKVLRVLVDIGSSADILFEGALRQLCIGGAQMVQVKTPLYGFAGDCVYTKGTITLPTTFGKAAA